MRIVIYVCLSVTYTIFKNTQTLLNDVRKVYYSKNTLVEVIINFYQASYKMARISYDFWIDQLILTKL